MRYLARAMTPVLLAAALLVIPSRPAAAQDLGASSDTTSVEYQQWQAELEDARSDRSRGQTFFWTGLGVAAAAPLVGSALITSGSGITTAQLAAVASTAGGVGAIYGGITWLQAANKIEELESEGQRRGYIALAPVIHGKRVDGARLTVSVPGPFSR